MTDNIIPFSPASEVPILAAASAKKRVKTLDFKVLFIYI